MKTDHIYEMPVECGDTIYHACAEAVYLVAKLNAPVRFMFNNVECIATIDTTPASLYEGWLLEGGA